MKLLYTNPLATKEDLSGFILEGQAKISFPNKCLRLENVLSANLNQKANYVLWCPEVFPSDLCIEWDFKPIQEPGLAILFFATKGFTGKNLFDSSLTPRTGEYTQYHHGDINAFHISYFRRKEPDERMFHTCNLRKSYGFHLVSQGADPIPDVASCTDFYHLKVIKLHYIISFYINNLKIFQFEDDGNTYGPLLTDGQIGFRQLAPMIGEYANLKVYDIS